MSGQLLTFIPHPDANYDYDYPRIVAEINQLVTSDQIKFLQFVRFWSQESLFFLLYFILRVPVNHPFLVDRIKEVQACHDMTLDLWAREHFKAIWIDTKVLTSNGWKCHGDLQPGDEVFGSNGQLVKVLANTGPMNNADCKKITFDDCEIIASSEHEWPIYRKRNPVISGTNKRINTWNDFVTEIVTTDKLPIGNRRKHLPRTPVINFPYQILPLPLDPYILGYWLGDGTTTSGRITTTDPEVLDYFALAGFEFNQYDESHYNIYGLQTVLKNINVFNNKHIPYKYLESSPADRLALLQGLMDSDGCCRGNSQCIFVNTNWNLSAGVHYLAASLGLKPTIYIENHGAPRKDVFCINFVGVKNTPVFRLKRKLDLCKEKYINTGRYTRSIEQVESVPVNCIQVDALDGIYLVGYSLIPTHNSTIITYGLNIMKILRDPNIRIGIFSHTRKIAQDFLRRIKLTFEDNDFLKKLFPDILYEKPQTQSPKWSEDDGILVKRNTIYQEMTVEAWGFDSMPTSKHFDRLNYDDIVTMASVTTPEQIAKVDEAFKISDNLGADDMISGKRGERGIVGTTYHFNDQYEKLKRESGWDPIKKEYTRDREPGDWIIRIHPAVGEDGLPVLLSPEMLAGKRRKQGPYVFACLPVNTVIVKSDFTLENIQDIKVGDHVLGIAKGSEAVRGGFCPSVVEAKSERVAEVVRFELSNGDYIDCTEAHNWWTGRWSSGDDVRKEYLPLKRTGGKASGKFGYVIKALELPWGELTRQEWECAAWLGGIFDGEGSCTGGSTLTITQSEKHNLAVCKRIEYTLKFLGFDFGICKCKGEKIGINIYYLKGGRNEIFRFLLLANPARRMQIVDKLLYRNSRIGGKANNLDIKVSVISETSMGKQLVYNIQTTTHNYIANGYVSSNCQQMLTPITKEDQRFKYEWIQRYKKLPTNLTLFLLCDPANEKKTKKTGSDYTVYWLWGLDSRGNKFLVDMVRDRLNPTERWTYLKKFILKWPMIQKIGYEEYGMTSDIHHIEKKMEDESFYFTRPIPLGGNKLSKADRIARLIPEFESGKIWLPEELYYTDKSGIVIDLVKVFINEEYLFFPFSSHDDMLDAASRIEDEDFNVWLPYDGPIDMSDDPRPLQGVVTTGWADTKAESRFAGL